MDLNKYYVLYDGDCGFCNYWVQWILKNDRKDIFRFAALQSNFGQQFLRERGLENNAFDTLYLWKPHTYYLIKSRAVTKIAQLLGGKYSILGLLNVLPVSMADALYNAVAKRRARLGNASCTLPTQEEKEKFIS